LHTPSQQQQNPKTTTLSTQKKVKVQKPTINLSINKNTSPIHIVEILNNNVQNVFVTPLGGGP
jgi:hypothetical protein